MPVQSLTQADPARFFNLPSANGSANGTGFQRLDTRVSGVAVSNDFSGCLSVTIVEGDLNEQEVKDLTRLFRKDANIFEKYLNGYLDDAEQTTVPGTVV